MHVCMIGLGAIGQRHLRNLIKVSKERNLEVLIDALRTNPGELQEDIQSVISQEYFDIQKLPDDYDIAFICNPTSLHYDTLKYMIPKAKHIFIEKPVFDCSGYKTEDLHLKSESIYYVACPLRHKSIIHKVKNLVNSGEQVIGVRAISTSYLPDWRKNRDYRKVYSAKKSLGGGVILDLIHEWDYLSYIFGIPKIINCLQGHFSDLEIDTEDYAAYIAQYEDKLIEVHLDYFGHKTERILQLFFNDKRIDVDLINNIMFEYQRGQLVDEKRCSEEDCYINEMNYFLDCIEGKKENFNTVIQANELLYRIL